MADSVLKRPHEIVKTKPEGSKSSWLLQRVAYLVLIEIWNLFFRKYTFVKDTYFQHNYSYCKSSLIGPFDLDLTEFSTLLHTALLY